jgi:hypothetical protein
MPVLRPKPRNSKPLVLRLNQRKPSPPVLRPNQRKPSDWFLGQTTHKPSTFILRLNQETCAPRLHVHGANRTQRHPTSRSPGHRVLNLCDDPRSSTWGLLLLLWSLSLHDMPHLPPAHHGTSKHNSPNEIEIKVKLPKCLGFEFKPRQVNNSSQSNQGTDHLVSHCHCEVKTKTNKEKKFGCLD